MRRAIAGRVLAVVAVFVAAVSFPSPRPAEAESGVYECTVTVGSELAYYDSTRTAVPHAVGGCRLVTLTAVSSVVSVSVPAGCDPLADTDGDGTQETFVAPGLVLPVTTQVWARCGLGVVDARARLELTESTAPPVALASLDRIEPFAVTAADGTVLRGHVYVPTGRGRLGTVLELSPYWNTSYGPSEEQETEVDGRRTMKGWHRPFLEAGFAVALVNMRGTGESDGCMQWGVDPDWSDAGTVVDALAAQPWSNGRVGMFGLSYPGWSQYMALAAKPKALKAVIPISAVIDYWSLLTRNGARLTIGPSTSTVWTAGTAGGAYASSSVLTNDRFVPDTSAGHLTCPRYAEDVAAHAQLAADGERTAYWAARDLRPLFAGSRVPALVTSGLTFDDGSITQFEGVWDLFAGPRRFLLGQWGHDIPPRPGFMAMAVAWMGQHLLPGAPTVPSGVVEYQDNRLGWHTATRWPPVATPTALHLSGSSLVSSPAAVQPSVRAFQSSGISQTRLCNAPDHVRYVSAPLTSDVLLAGNATVDLTLTSTLPEGNLAVHVYDVDASGACNAVHVDVARALTTLRHAASPGSGRDFPLLQPTAVSVRSLPFAARIPAGHRIAVLVGADAGDIQPDVRKPRIEITTGLGVKGSVTLPVVEGALTLS